MIRERFRSPTKEVLARKLYADITVLDLAREDEVIAQSFISYVLETSRFDNIIKFITNSKEKSRKHEEILVALKQRLLDHAVQFVIGQNESPSRSMSITKGRFLYEKICKASGTKKLPEMITMQEVCENSVGMQIVSLSYHSGNLQSSSELEMLVGKVISFDTKIRGSQILLDKDDKYRLGVDQISITHNLRHQLVIFADQVCFSSNNQVRNLSSQRIDILHFPLTRAQIEHIAKNIFDSLVSKIFMPKLASRS